MDLDIASHQAGSYQVSTEVYAGPLDLLLQLIERAELDITRLALAQVTDQFLEHLRKLPDSETAEVSAFLVIAAKLIQIKSEALLPRPPVRQEGEEDPGEALARQLQIYKQFKKLSQALGEREAAGYRTYLRLAPSPKVEGILDLSGISLKDLTGAARSVYAKITPAAPLASLVAAPRVTIREKISLISLTLRSLGRASFRRFLGLHPSQIDIVVTFLALLELIKRRMVRVEQESLFGEILVEPSASFDESEQFELEFGE